MTFPVNMNVELFLSMSYSTIVGDVAYRAERTVFTKGSPRYAISELQLRFLLQCAFSIKVRELSTIKYHIIKC